MTVDQVVFLVGGTGSRLGTLTAATPKPVLPVGGRPFLDYLLDEASRYGFSRCLLLCGYRAQSIEKAYQAGGRTLLEVLDAERNYRDTYRTYITNRANYWRAVYRFNSAIGKQVLQP